MSIMKGMSPWRWDYWRIVLALAAKDIVDALKNKTTLTVVLGLSMMMLTVEALPLLLGLDGRPAVAIYDGARSGLADELRRTGAVQVRELRLAGEAAVVAREASQPLVAVTLPAGWEDGAGTLTIAGYIAHWNAAGRADAVAERVAEVEDALAAVAGRPVTIQTTTVYPTLDSGGHTIMVALGIVLATMLVTTILVPYLILEEKTARTLDLLRVSPAGVGQLLLGKGLAGLVYGAAAAAVLIGFNLTMVNQWGLLLSVLLGIIFLGVGLGLLAGTMVKNEGAVQLWIGLLSVVLMFPLMLVFVDSSRLPSWAGPLLAWLPTIAAFDLIRLSFGNQFPPSLVWPKLAAVFASVALIFFLAGRRMRAGEGY